MISHNATTIVSLKITCLDSIIKGLFTIRNNAPLENSYFKINDLKNNTASKQHKINKCYNKQTKQI